MIRAIEGKITSDDVIQNYNRCIVHFLDIANTTTMKEYLKLAWSAGSFNANNIYFIYHLRGHTNEQANLNFPGLLDFQKVNLVMLRPLVYNFKFQAVKMR